MCFTPARRPPRPVRVAPRPRAWRPNARQPATIPAGGGAGRRTLVEESRVKVLVAESRRGSGTAGTTVDEAEEGAGAQLPPSPGRPCPSAPIVEGLQAGLREAEGRGRLGRGVPRPTANDVRPSRAGPRLTTGRRYPRGKGGGAVVGETGRSSRRDAGKRTQAHGGLGRPTASPGPAGGAGARRSRWAPPGGAGPRRGQAVTGAAPAGETGAPRSTRADRTRFARGSSGGEAVDDQAAVCRRAPTGPAWAGRSGGGSRAAAQRRNRRAVPVGCRPGTRFRGPWRRKGHGPRPRSPRPGDAGPPAGSWATSLPGRRPAPAPPPRRRGTDATPPWKPWRQVAHEGTSLSGAAFAGREGFVGEGPRKAITPTRRGEQAPAKKLSLLGLDVGAKPGRRNPAPVPNRGGCSRRKQVGVLRFRGRPGVRFRSRRKSKTTIRGPSVR